MTSRWPVTFEPAGVTAWVEAGQTVLDAARRAGVVIPAPCGGRGVCGKCAVRVVDGEPSPPDDIEKRGLSAAPAGIRLACRLQVAGPLTVKPMFVSGSQAQHAESAESEERYIAGVDLGTTTCSAVIVGAASGRELGRAAVPNSQVSFGADVLSRIDLAAHGEGSALASAAVTTIFGALAAACGAAGACLERVDAVTIAANSAMAALLVGSPTTSLATAPFSLPEHIDGPVVLDGLNDVLAEGARVEIAPPLGGFVGGDVVAGLLAAGLLDTDEQSIYIDIGTNAEIVVRGKRGAAYASVAAGPAFEGYGISGGGPAGPGAIVGAEPGDDLVITTFDKTPPEWIAGSGLVDAIAALRAVDHLGPEGLLSSNGPWHSRFDSDSEGVARIGLGPDGAAPYLTQLDIRAFQTAKAAVAAGLLTVCAQLNVKSKKVTRTVVAGGFGAALNADALVALGVIPEDLRTTLETFGPAALIGAGMLAFDSSAAEAARTLIQSAEKVELASEESFNTAFVKATHLGSYTLKTGFA